MIGIQRETPFASPQRSGSRSQHLGAPQRGQSSRGLLLHLFFKIKNSGLRPLGRERTCGWELEN